MKLRVIKENTDTLRLITCAIISLFLAFYAELYLEAYRYYLSGNYSGLLADSLTTNVVFRLIIALVGFFIVCYLFSFVFKRFLHFSYEYRYLIALGILIICVVFCISGSSISLLNNWLGGSEDSGITLGIPRNIRSDEWIVSTPLIFSQEANNYLSSSTLVRGTATDITFVYGLPAWGVLDLFTPLNWGYLILGSDRGLAFAWAARFLALFLTSFECAMIYTKKNKQFSFAIAVLIAFSPFCMWWGDGLFFIYGQGLVLALYYYLRAPHFWQRSLLMLLICWLAGCYLFTMYPAWEVPMFYVFAFMGIWVVLEYRQERKSGQQIKGFLNSKFDIPVIVVLVAALAVLSLSVFRISSNTIQVVADTAYPGARFSNGGGAWNSLLGYASGMFFSVDADRALPNACESSSFFSLFPLGIILAVVAIAKRGKKDFLLVSFLVLDIAYIWFMVVGVPDFVAKYSLMSNVPPTRLVIATGYLDIVLLFRAMSLICQKNEEKNIQTCSLLETGPSHSITKNNNIVIIIISLVAACALVLVSYLSMPSFYRFVYLVLLLLVFFSLLYCIAASLVCVNSVYSYCLLALIAAFMIPVGATVNPIQIGSSIVNDSAFSQAVDIVDSSDGDSEDHDLWLAVDVPAPIPNLCAAAGAETINTTNNYPDVDRWKLLDPDGEYENVYNRYTHIAVVLTNEDTWFELTAQDAMTVHLNYEDIKKLDVDYIVSLDDSLETESTADTVFDLADSADGYYIYALSYR